jgi:hypothetical protein
MEELSRILLTKSGRSDVATSINTTRTIPEFWQILDERAGDGKDPKRDRRALVQCGLNTFIVYYRGRVSRCSVLLGGTHAWSTTARHRTDR